MKWRTGGWQRADHGDPRRAGREPVDPERATVPKQAGRRTTHYPPNEAPDRGPGPRNVPGKPAGGQRGQPRSPAPPLLSPDARDVDVSAGGFRQLAVGGGITGLLTVVCAAALANRGGGVWLWIWQLVFAVTFLGFLSASRGVFAGRGFLFDRGAFYARTQGQVFGVGWEEIAAIGVGTLPWIEHRRPVNPQRRHALEFFPVDVEFPQRHPELDRWLVEEPSPTPGLLGIRYRFHLPALSRLPSGVETAVRRVAGQKWAGRYRRNTP